MQKHQTLPGTHSVRTLAGLRIACALKPVLRFSVTRRMRVEPTKEPMNIEHLEPKNIEQGMTNVEVTHFEPMNTEQGMLIVEHLEPKNIEQGITNVEVSFF